MRVKNKKVIYLLGGVLLAILIVSSVFAQEDVEGSKDHTLLTRMPNFYIQDFYIKDFDKMEFVDIQGRETTVEGKRYYISYYIKKGVQPPSDLQILRNYINAILKIGGVKIYEGRYDAYLKVDKGGTNIWIHVRSWNDGEGCDLNILEETKMVQEVTADAKSMAQDISATGKVAVYGIYFDFDKADIKPESEPAIKEIAKLLQENKGLKLYLVGHTDNVGNIDYNMKLSKARADAVMKELVTKYRVTSERLKAYGVGSLAPVASNRTDDGRAKNRRVELVEQ